MWCLIRSRASLPLHLLYITRIHRRQPAPRLQHLSGIYQPLHPDLSHPALSQRLPRCQYHAEYGSQLLLLLVLTYFQLPPRRAMERNRTAPSPGPGEGGAIVGASPSPAPPLALNLADVASTDTQLPTVRKSQYPSFIGDSRDCVMRSHHSLSPKRADSRRAGEQIRALTPLPL
jgi:hypothetical protein